MRRSALRSLTGASIIGKLCEGRIEGTMTLRLAPFSMSRLVLYVVTAVIGFGTPAACSRPGKPARLTFDVAVIRPL
jgi:hypothetical protein